MWDVASSVRAVAASMCEVTISMWIVTEHAQALTGAMWSFTIYMSTVVSYLCAVTYSVWIVEASMWALASSV